MKLFQSNNGTVKDVKSNPFKLEKEIQDLVENNLEELFKLQMVKSEFPLKNFRLDTLAFDKETNAFVIIEYKRDKKFSVIDQGYSYLSLMLNNKADFILEYNENRKETLKRDDVDWSQSRVLFVAPSFTQYQKHSVDFKDVPFELWEIKRFEGDLISMTQHKSDSSESISSIEKDSSGVISKVSKEVKVYDEDYHLTRSKNRPEWVVELYQELKDRILQMDDVQIKVNGLYISFKKDEPIVDVLVFDNGLALILNVKSGQLKDPNGLAKDVSQKNHQGTGDYKVVIDAESDLDEVMYLIKQTNE